MRRLGGVLATADADLRSPSRRRTREHSSAARPPASAPRPPCPQTHATAPLPQADADSSVEWEPYWLCGALQMDASEPRGCYRMQVLDLDPCEDKHTEASAHARAPAPAQG